MPGTLWAVALLSCAAFVLLEPVRSARGGGAAVLASGIPLDGRAVGVCAGLSACHALLSFRPDATSFLWLAGAGLLAYPQRRALARLVRRPAAGAVPFAAMGVAAAGAVLCFGSLFLTWHQGSYYLGGFENRFSPGMVMNGYSGSYGLTYNPASSYTSYSMPGRTLPLAPLAVSALGALVLLGRSGPPRTPGASWTVAVLAAIATGWGLSALSAHPGPWLYVVGVLAVDAVVVSGVLRARAAAPGRLSG